MLKCLNIGVASIYVTGFFVGSASSATSVAAVDGSSGCQVDVCGKQPMAKLVCLAFDPAPVFEASPSISSCYYYASTRIVNRSYAWEGLRHEGVLLPPILSLFSPCANAFGSHIPIYSPALCSAAYAADYAAELPV